MQIRSRLHAALKAATTHFGLSLVVALIAAAVVFGVWYPYPYRDFSGGRELFLLVVVVDVVCGPLLTFVLYNPSKPRAELVRDLGLVALIQMVALIYGVWTVWQVRPLFLVNEFDRFKVITLVDVGKFDLSSLSAELQPKLWTGPMTVGLRPPKDAQEREKVLFESVQGGADYAERPEFYLPYVAEVAIKSLERAKNPVDFLKRHPQRAEELNAVSRSSGIALAQLKYVPVVARADWIALVDKTGRIVGFVPGDGF